MKKKSIFLILILLTSSVSLAGTYSGGDGTENNPYQITVVADWQELSAAPDDWSDHFILTSDLDFSGISSLIPVGEYSNKFTGVFDGDNHVISNIMLDVVPQSRCFGLFGEVGSKGEIKNLGLMGFEVTAVDLLAPCGSLVGRNSGMIKNCYAAGQVQGCCVVGGLVGANEGIIMDCHAIVSVSSGASPCPLGGLCGTNGGIIKNSYAEGDVLGPGYEESVGGLVGENGGTISSCYATGSVRGGIMTLYVGGLVGNNGGTIHDCYATGSLLLYEDGALLGGLVGLNSGQINSCYAAGSMPDVEYTSVGGLIGDYFGGLLTANFWDTETSGTMTGIGYSWIDYPDGVVGMTSSEMKTKMTFTDAGWDFISAWAMPIGQYPMLLPRLAGDVDDDNKVDLADLAILAENWLLSIPTKEILVGFWEFSENTGGFAHDSSPFKNHGALKNNPVWTGTGALSFDGIDDYVEIPRSSSLELEDAITVSARIFFTEFSTDWPKLVTKPHTSNSAPWEMFTLDLGHYGRYPRFIITDGITGGQVAYAFDSNRTLELNQWYHIVGTYDGATIALYLDGQLVASNPATISMGQNYMPIGIGGRLGSNSFNGLIDEVRIYNRALDAIEIQNLFQSYQ